MSEILILKTCRGAPFQRMLAGLSGVFYPQSQDRAARLKIIYSEKDLLRDRKNFIRTLSLEPPLSSFKQESPYYKLFEALNRNLITVKTVKRFSDPLTITNLIFKENPKQIIICGSPGAGFWWLFPLKIVAMLKKIPLFVLNPAHKISIHSLRKITLNSSLKWYLASFKILIANFLTLIKELARTVPLAWSQIPQKSSQKISIIPASIGNPLYFEEALPKNTTLTLWMKNQRIFQIFPEEMETLRKDERTFITSNLTEALKKSQTLIVEFADTPLFPYDVILWKLAGKRIILHLRGCEARDPMTNPGCLFCTLPTCSEQKRRKIHLAGKFAEAILVSTPDLLLSLPVEMLKKSHYIPTTPAQSASRKIRQSPGKKIPKVFHTSLTSPTKGAWLFEEISPVPTVISEKTLSHEKFIEELSKYAYYFDQMLLGWFGVSSLEALQAGTTPITYLAVDELLKKIPFIENNPVFVHILKNKDLFVNPYRPTQKAPNRNSTAGIHHSPDDLARFLKKLKTLTTFLWKSILLR